MTGTRRERIRALLEAGEWGFWELQRELEVPVAVLREDLRHLARSLRGAGRRLVVSDPVCRECGFRFPGRGDRHLHPPGRCARCSGHQVEAQRFRVE